MAHTETTPDDLWEIVDSRKKARPSRPWPIAPADSALHGPATDAVLVDVLYQSLREADTWEHPGSAHALAMLRTEIGLSISRAAATELRSRPTGSPRSVARFLIAAALIVLISAAVASIVKTAKDEYIFGPRILNASEISALHPAVALAHARVSKAGGDIKAAPGEQSPKARCSAAAPAPSQSKVR